MADVVEAQMHAGNEAGLSPAETEVMPVVGRPYNTINPLYEHLQRLSRHSHWWLMAAAIGLVVGVGQSFPMLFAGVFAPSGPRSNVIPFPFILFSALRDAGAIGAFIVPILIAAVSASATARETSSESYELILLTDLTNVQIIRAYIRNAVQRSRALWAFQIGLTVPTLIAALNRPQFFGGFRYYGGIYLGQRFVSLLVRMSSYMPALLIRIPWLILAILCGVWLAQRLRTVLGAMLGAMLSLFIAQALYAIISVDLLVNTTFIPRGYGYAPNNNSPNPTVPAVSAATNQDLGYALLTVVVALLVPFAAWLMFIWLPAQVRRHS